VADVIELVKDVDYVYMILITGGLGAIGGIGAELLLKRAGNTGTIEIPGRLKGTRYVDIGFPASLILGAIAAIAILYFFPPVIEKVTVSAGGGQPTTTHEYDLVKLVALSLIVGSAGPAFLSTTQSRLMSALNAQKADTALKTSKTQFDQIAKSAKTAVAGAVQEAVAEHIPDADSDTVKAVADAATESLETKLEPQVAAARDQMEAVAQAKA
jgi:hypothetical protein